MLTFKDIIKKFTGNACTIKTKRIKYKKKEKKNREAARS